MALGDLEGVYRLFDAQNRRLEDLQKAVDTGFEGINNRLDKLNGQTKDNSTDIVKIKTASKVVGIIYGGLITLIGLSGGCEWLKDQQKISAGPNSSVQTAQNIR